MSISKRGKGYRVRWRMGNHHYSKQFDRKRDAEYFEAELRRRRQFGTMAEFVGGEELFSTFFQDSWTPRAEARLSPETFRSYQYLYSSLMADSIGNIKLNQLSTEVVEQWQAQQLTIHGAGVVWQAHKLLSSVLNDAVRTGRISKNPLALVKKPEVEHREIPQLPAPKTTEKIRQYMLNRSTPLASRDALIVTLMAYAGLRPEEVRGLRWRDVGEGTLFIRRVLVESGFRDTKTRQHRSIRMLDAVKADLLEAREAAGWPDGDQQVILAADGGPFGKWAFKQWSTRVFKPAAKAVGAGDLIPYDLRHAFASLLLAEGRNVVYVASQLGHKPTLTLDTYGHVIADLEDQPSVDANELIAHARDTSSEPPPEQTRLF